MAGRRLWGQSCGRIWLPSLSRQMCEGTLKYLQYGTFGSPSIVSTVTSPQNGAPPTTSKGGWRKTGHHLTLASTKLFLQCRELVFCRCHPASSGICRHSLLTRNTQFLWSPTSIPLQECIWHHCIFYVGQGWNAHAALTSTRDTPKNTGMHVEMLWHHTHSKNGIKFIQIKHKLKFNISMHIPV